MQSRITRVVDLPCKGCTPPPPSIHLSTEHSLLDQQTAVFFFVFSFSFSQHFQQIHYERFQELNNFFQHNNTYIKTKTNFNCYDPTEDHNSLGVHCISNRPRWMLYESQVLNMPFQRTINFIAPPPPQHMGLYFNNKISHLNIPHTQESLNHTIIYASFLSYFNFGDIVRYELNYINKPL